MHICRMKSLYIWMTVVLVSCKSNHKDHKADIITKFQTTSGFQWLEGNWIEDLNSTVSDSQKLLVENWFPGDQKMIGFAPPNHCLDSSLMEKMTITMKDSFYYFIAFHGDSNRETIFKITQRGRTSFHSENNSHDFPKFIAYGIENEKLIAKIGDERDTITYRYNKANE